MSQRKTNRYENLSDEALFKLMARGRGNRRNQVKRVMSRRGMP